MNGFVIFDRDEAVGRFLQAVKNSGALRQGERIVRSRTMAMVLYRDLTSQEVATFRRLAEHEGGRVEESTKYMPVAG